MPEKPKNLGGRPSKGRVRSNLYLDEDVEFALTAEALRRGISKNDLATEALRAYLFPTRK